MEHNNKRCLRLRLTTLVSALLFLSCSTFANTRTQITFWTAMAGPLGVVVQNIANQFNASQSEYEVVPIFKGTYSQTLTATVAAFRAHQQPDIVQIFEVGTATMIHPKGVIVPFYKLMQEYKQPLDENDFLPAIRYYYSDNQGNLLALPFNSSSPVLFYNKTEFKKAGLDPNKAPTTWPEVVNDSKKLLKAGNKCGFTSAWPSWILVENFSAWHNLPFATDGNGFDGVDAKLLYNNPTMVKQFQDLNQWQHQHIFQYGGRGDDPLSLFTSSDCAMIMESSGARAGLVANTNFGIGIAPIPYWPSIKGAPQNTILGGAAIWVLTGHSKHVYKGVAEFLAFMLKPKIQAEFAKDTGYLPVTKSAYKLLQQQGYYEKNKGADVAIKELMNKPPTKNSRGFRLGNYMRIRDINNTALESVFSGAETAKQALDTAVKNGNALIHQFAEDVSIK